MELSKSYDAADTEKAVAQVWKDENAFHAEPDPDKESFVVVIPPPNVTAALHLGHALNNTIQDILVRRARMRGLNAVWLPGTDHAGIATQTVVEKRVLAEEGKRRTDFERAEFIAKIQAWKDEYEQKILGQLIAMGCSCDFDRTAFTMDEQRAKAVREAFFRLFKDGLIYRGKRLVNWDPATQTALADDEVEMEDVEGSFWYLKYPLVDSDETITVATTRPETMLGDTAIAVNPRDEARKHLIGRTVKLPIVGREIPIIGDEYVVIPDANSSDPKAKYASGFLKVTPAHDPNDWEIGQRHGLEVINLMAPDASISDAYGWTPETEDAKAFVGKSREDARTAVVDYFKDHGLLAEVRPYSHAIGHSYRSHVAIEPYLSDQWYVAMKKQIPSLDDEGILEGTDVPKNSLAGFALTALSTSRDREGATPAQPATPDRATNTYFITFTTYGTPLHGSTKGTVDPLHNAPGTPLLPPDEDFEAFKRERMAGDPVSLGEAQREATHDAIIGVADHRQWEIHALHVRTTHVHAVVTADDTPEKVMNDFKSYATRRIREAQAVTDDAKVWTRHGSTRWLNDDASFSAAVAYVVEGQGEALAPAPSTSRDRLEATPAQPATIAPTVAEGAAGAASLPDGRGSSELRFVPDRYEKTYRAWHENLRDWCISRQLWWGHRIPVWELPEDADDPSNSLLDERWKTLSEGVAEGGVAIRFGGDELPARELGLAVYTYQHSGLSSEVDGRGIEVSFTDKRQSPSLERLGFQQDPDVLDTWFSSALWPISTLGWPDSTPELAAWNPTSVLCTAREIITLWVGRMVMFNRYFRGGDLPFKDVFIHAMIQDGHGQKMSKSLGNGVDPLDIIHSHGADAMRFTLCQMTTHTQDVRMPVDMIDPHTGEAFEPQMFVNKSGYTVTQPTQTHKGKQMVSSYGLASGEATPTDDMPLARNTSSKFDLGRNFCNKLWNASKFVMAGVADGELATTPNLTAIDRWILSRLAKTIAAVNDASETYRFDRYATAIYDFVWRDYCDWYIEAAKPALRDEATAATTRVVLATCLDTALRLLSPITPFITERLWWALNDVAPQRGIAGMFDLPPSDRCMLAHWPAENAAAIDEDAESAISTLQELATAIRTVRNENNADPKKKYPVTILNAPASVVENASVLELWAGCTLSFDTAPADAAKTTAAGCEVYVEGVVDKAAGAKRQAELAKKIAAMKGRLANKGYTDKAPEHLVQQTRDELAAAEAELVALS